MSFLGLFRKKARAEEIGAYVTEFVFKPLTHCSENLEPWLDGETERQALVDELFLLQAFAVSYALSLVLRDGPVRERALSAFYATLFRRAGAFSVPVSCSEEVLRRRESVYREGIGGSPSNPTAGVGRIFASLLPYEDRERIAEQAAVEFASTVTAVTRFLMRHKAV